MSESVENHCEWSNHEYETQCFDLGRGGRVGLCDQKSYRIPFQSNTFEKLKQLAYYFFAFSNRKPTKIFNKLTVILTNRFVIIFRTKSRN